jgi:hypothetical protein
MVMTRRYLLTVGVVAGMLAAAVWAGVSGIGQGGARWEYGIFRGEGVWTWYGLDEAVDNADRQEFADKIQAKYSQRDAELEVNVLNSLATQGWELVAAPEKNKYVLRRPR